MLTSDQKNRERNYELLTKNISLYAKSEIEGCDGKNEIKNVSIRVKKDKTIKVKTSMLYLAVLIQIYIYLHSRRSAQMG